MSANELKVKEHHSFNRPIYFSSPLIMLTLYLFNSFSPLILSSYKNRRTAANTDRQLLINIDEQAKL